MQCNLLKKLCIQNAYNRILSCFSVSWAIKGISFMSSQNICLKNVICFARNRKSTAIPGEIGCFREWNRFDLCFRLIHYHDWQWICVPTPLVFPGTWGEIRCPNFCAGGNLSLSIRLCLSVVTTIGSNIGSKSMIEYPMVAVYRNNSPEKT